VEWADSEHHVCAAEGSWTRWIAAGQMRGLLPDRSTLSRSFPVIRWFPEYRREQLSGDVIAGVIVAVMLIPQGMAYATLAGLPPQVGLYASIVPLIIYGLMGTSPALGVGPTAIASVMTASAVGAIASEGTDRYVEMAILLTFLVGIIRLGLGLIRAGFLVNFMSRPVLSGFVNAAALIIAGSQIAHLLGLQTERADTFAGQIWQVIQNVGTFNVWTAILGFGSLALLLYFQLRSAKHLQQTGLNAHLAQTFSRTGPLITAVAATVIVWLASLDSQQGVPVVGEVSRGLPPLTVPDFDPDLIRSLVPSALVISLVGFMESISIAKSLASRERQGVDANQELVAIGAANIGASFSGGFTVTGSFSRSVLNYRSGATSGIASIITALLVLMTVLILTPLFAYLPRAALSAIVVMAILGLLELSTFRRVWAYRRLDATTLIITFVAVLVLGIELGIVVGILSSVGLYLWQTSHPAIVELGLVRGTDAYRNVVRHQTVTDPRVLLLRVDESLYFANTQKLQTVTTAYLHNRPEMAYLVLAGTSINDIDASALETLEELNLQLSAAGVSMHLAGFKVPVLEALRNTLLMQMIGPDRTHLTVNGAVAAINRDLPDDMPYGTYVLEDREREA
jgi:sulfate permease, SulP family